MRLIAALTGLLILAGCGGGATTEAQLAGTPPPPPIIVTVPPPSTAAAADFVTGQYTNLSVTGTVAPAIDPYTSARVGALVQSQPLTGPIPAGFYSHVVSGYASPVNGTGTFFQLDDGSDTNRVTVRIAGFAAFATAVVGGVNAGEVYLGRVLPTAKFNVGVSILGGTLRASLNGKLEAAASVALPALSRIQFGGGAAGPWQAVVSNYERRSVNSASDAVSVQLAAAGLYDDFDRPNGSLGSPPTGQTYVQAVPWPQGPVQVEGYADIVNRQLVTRDSGTSVTASYNGVALASAPTQFLATVAFSPGTLGSGNASLVAQANGLRTVQDITSNSIHIGFLDNAVQVQKFSNGVFSVVANIRYASPCARDGVTLYNVGWRIVGNKVVLLLPDGSFSEVTDTSLVAKNGPYVIYESFWQGQAASQSKFAAISVQ